MAAPQPQYAQITPGGGGGGGGGAPQPQFAQVISADGQAVPAGVASAPAPMPTSQAVEGAVMCESCGEAITDVILRAFGLTYHTYCLACAVCEKDFTEGGKVEESPEGYAYCTPCYIETYAPKCGMCAKSIVGPLMNALNKQWHAECFVCYKCKCNFAGGNFYPGPDGVPYCEKHFYEAQGLLCNVCEKPVLGGKVVRFDDKVYHPEHFCCSLCKTKLMGKPYKKKNLKPYCGECFNRLYG